MPVGSSLQDILDADRDAPTDSSGFVQDPVASFAPPTGVTPSTPVSPAAAPPPAVQPTSQPAQSPQEVAQAQQAILSSPALSEQQKQSALAALPKIPPPAPTPAPVGTPSPAVTPPQGAQPPMRGVPYSAGPSSSPQGAPPGGLSTEQAMALARAGQGQGAPAGWHPTTRTQEGIDLSPDTQEALRARFGAEASATKAQLDLEGAQGGAQARADKILGAYDEAQALQDKVHRQAQESELGTYHDHIQSLMRESERAADINPNQFWDSKSTGQKILLGLGMALRGFSFGLTGHGDPLEWLNQQIHENIEGQKAKAAAAKGKVGEAVNLYALNKEKLGDEDRAYQATALAQRQALMGSLQRTVADASAEPAMRLRANQLYGALAKDQSETLLELDKLTGKHVTSEAFRERTTGGADALATIRKAVDIRKASQELEGTDVGTRKGEAEIGKLESEGGKGPSQQQQAEISKAYQSAGIPAAQTALDRADDLVRGGAAARSLATLGLPRQTAVGGIVGNVAAGADARELHAVLRQVAEAQAHASGQRGVEAIEYNLKNIMGNGTEEDIQRGLARARSSIDAQKSAIQAGASPSSAGGFTDRLQRSGAEAPPGYQPGILGGQP